MSLYDRLVPAEALRWGALTAEDRRWHLDVLAYRQAILVRKCFALLPPVRRSRLPWRKRR